MDLDLMNSIVAEIVLGKPKEESKAKDEPDFSAIWDKLKQDVKDIHNRSNIVDIPVDWT